MIVTAHAAQRWQERVDPRASRDDPVAAITLAERAVAAAARFRCGTVRLGNGARLVLAGETVVTVLAPGCRFNACSRRAA